MSPRESPRGRSPQGLPTPGSLRALWRARVVLLVLLLPFVVQSRCGGTSRTGVYVGIVGFAAPLLVRPDAAGSVGKVLLVYDSRPVDAYNEWGGGSPATTPAPPLWR